MIDAVISKVSQKPYKARKPSSAVIKVSGVTDTESIGRKRHNYSKQQAGEYYGKFRQWRMMWESSGVPLSLPIFFKSLSTITELPIVQLNEMLKHQPYSRRTHVSGNAQNPFRFAPQVGSFYLFTLQ